jgi:hypothetical protein
VVTGAKTPESSIILDPCGEGTSPGA